MLAITWRRGQREPHIAFRARVGGEWRDWQRFSSGHDSADPQTEEAGAKDGTEVVWVGRADGLQLRVGGNRPADLTLVLLQPLRMPTDRELADPGPTAPSDRTAARTVTTEGVPRPNIRSRRQWGADEDMRERPPSYEHTIKQVHVHHTVNSNDYTRTDVPAMIRGMYAYHTSSLGWSDIGYNFLVDRFGRIWAGRAGGAARPVRGAHTLGFNASSTGVAAIGNYDTAAPPRAMVAAIARLAAWKLDKYGRDPQGRTSVRSEGSDRYPPGRVVTLPVIDGHRDTNDTAYPGRHLYSALPAIRRRAAARIERFR